MSVPRETPGTPRHESGDLRRSGLHWTNYRFARGSNSRTQENFLSLAVSYGLTEYVRAKLKQDNSIVQTKKGCPMLLYLVPVGPVGVRFLYSFPASTELLSLLIEYGADPNARFCGASLWQEAIEGRYMEYPDDEYLQQRRIATCRVLIEAGAHPNVLWHRVEASRTATSHFAVEMYTPLALESLDSGLYETLKSRGAIAIEERIQLNAVTKQIAEEEALRLKEEVAKRWNIVGGRGLKRQKIKYWLQKRGKS